MIKRSRKGWFDLRKFSRATQNFIRYGLPMMIFMLAGSYGLSEFTEVRVKKKEEISRMLTAEEAMPFLLKKPESLESLHEQLSDKLPEWNGDQIRGPRPYGE